MTDCEIKKIADTFRDEFYAAHTGPWFPLFRKKHPEVASAFIAIQDREDAEYAVSVDQKVSRDRAKRMISLVAMDETYGPMMQALADGEKSTERDA